MTDHLTKTINRRRFLKTAAAVAATSTCPSLAAGAERSGLNWIVASSLYGCLDLEVILPELPKQGAKYIDIWPAKHGNQREQMEAMGHERFAELLASHGVKLGMLTRYDLGPFGLQQEMAVAEKLGAKIIICGGKGPRGLAGPELKAAVKQFVEEMKPHIAAAEKHGVVIGVENHGNNLIESPDSMKWLVELADSKHLGVALAPYHLPQDPALLTSLAEDLGDRLVHFYAWQHGMGCMDPLPKEQELLQMPGRGTLDFAPILSTLKRINYTGWTSVFMHPVPRGIPILPTAPEVTAEIMRAQKYLKKCNA